MNGEIGFTGTLSGSIDAGGSGGTSNYNELSNKPSINGVTLQGNKTSAQLNIFDGNYNNTTNKPSINGTTLQGDNTTETLGLFDGNYSSLVGKPVLAEVATSGSYEDLNHKPTIPEAQVNSDWDASSGVAAILNKPSLATVATSGSYNDLSNKPTIPAAQVNADWDAVSGVAQILNKPTIPAAQVNSDWDASSGVAEILNKPTLATVATSGSYNDLSNKPTIPDEADEITYDNTTSGILATDVQEAIDVVCENVSTINSSLTKLDYFTLLNGEIVSNTKTTITLFGNRKLSDYKFFIALVRINAVTKASMYVPKTALQQASDQLSMFYVDSSNVQRWFEITYKSDTQVDIQSSANVASSTAIYLYGYN